MNSMEENRVYEKTTDNESYHGGYKVSQYIHNKNSYLGGNPKNSTLFEEKVIPFGLFYDHPQIQPKDEKCIDGGLIQDNMFDKLLLSVGKIEKNGGKQKTRKNH